MPRSVPLALALSLVACKDDAPDTGPSGGPDYDALWAQTLEDVEAWAAERGIPGVGLAVVLDGELAYSGGVGVRSMTTGEPVTADTLFRSSSAASKTLVAAAVLDAAEDGLIDPDRPIAELIPGITVDPTYADAITLHELMIQRAGTEGADFRSGCTAEDASALTYFDEAPVVSLAPPGDLWLYSALGSVAGAAALEAAEGRPFQEVLFERILTPAGVVSATYDLAAAQAADHATGHFGAIEFDFDDSAAGSGPCGDYQASAGFLASAADHARFLRVLLGHGPLEPASLALLGTDPANAGVFGAPWGYGWQSYELDYKGVQVYTHYGTNDGYNGGTTWVPERDFGLVLLTNGEGTLDRIYDLEQLRYDLTARFLELEGAEPDSATDPSTWSEYVGTYADPRFGGTRYVVTQEPDATLKAAFEPFFATPMAMTQGSIDSPYQGGDVWHFTSGDTLFLAAFADGPSGEAHYMSVYTTAMGYGQMVAERVD